MKYIALPSVCERARIGVYYYYYRQKYNNIIRKPYGGAGFRIWRFFWRFLRSFVRSLIFSILASDAFRLKRQVIDSQTVRVMPNIPRKNTRLKWSPEPNTSRQWQREPDKRYNSKRWRNFSKSYRKRYPVCAVPGCGKPSDVTDHINPVTQGGAFWSGPFQTLCHSCHNKKTNKDRQTYSWRLYVVIFVLSLFKRVKNKSDTHLYHPCSKLKFDAFKWG